MIASKSASSSAYEVSMRQCTSGIEERTSRQTSTPLPSGRRTSSTATSGRAAGMRWSASAVEPASPTTSMSRSSPSRSASPRRTISWSSMRKTRMGPSWGAAVMGVIVHHGTGAGWTRRMRDRGRARGAGWPRRCRMGDGALGSAVQLLTPEGERVHHPDYDISLGDAELRGLYRDMVLVRRIDAEATALQRQGELGLWASSLGQEAAQVGSARTLRPGDFAFPTYRDHGVTWSRGVPPLEILSMFRGVTTGGWDPNARGCAIYTIVIGNQALHGVGYAMGVQLDGSDDAVIAYFGDGATDEGDVNEAFVFGAVFNAPVVFFCQNNQWAISSPRDRNNRVPLYERAAGFGFPGVQVDGNDILAVMAVTREALERARTGGGPDVHRGLHVPHGRPHDVRRPDALPARGGPGDLAAARSDRAAQGLPRPAGHRRPRLLRPGRARGRRAGHRSCATGCARCPSRRRPRCSTTCTPSRTRRSSDSARSCTRTRPRSPTGAGHDRAHDGRRRSTPGSDGAMERDPKVVLIGEDIGRLGGVFRITDGLQKDFGEHRVIDAPLAESGIVGAAVGMAMRGLPSRRRDPVRRLRLPGLRPDRVAGGEDASPHRGRGARCRW